MASSREEVLRGAANNEIEKKQAEIEKKQAEIERLDDEITNIRDELGASLFQLYNEQLKSLTDAP